ncbi:unnamed protein product [Caenorhabditis brenneri]
MNNLRFSSGYPAFPIKKDPAPNRREEKEEFKELSDTFQQGLRLCSPRLQASMDDYSINYHCSLVTRSSAHFEMSSGVVRKLKRSSSLGSACGFVTPKRSLSSPPILRELIGGKKAVTLNLASPTKDFNPGTPLVTLSNLSTPRTNFSTDGANGSCAAGLQLVSKKDGSAMTKMHGTPMEHFHSGGEMSPNTVSHSSVPTISDDFDRVPSSPLANGTMNERASLLDKFTIVVSPHLDSSATSLEEQRRAAKLARTLEEPYEFNSQNRMMAEYEEQLTPMDNSNGFDFTSLSPTFLSASMEDTKWESSLIFQFENQVRLGVTSEASPTEPQVPELKFDGDGSAMTKMPRDHFRIPEQFNMEAEMLANIAPDRNLLINLSSPNQSDVNGASFANGTGNEQNAALVDDLSAVTQSRFNVSMDSIEEKLCTANLVKHLEEPYEYNLQHRIMADYELQLSPINFSYEYASNLSSPTFLQHSSEVGNWKERLVFQFPIQPQSENNRDSKPTAAESDEQFSFTSIHARRLAARMVRQEERENEFNGQNRVMYEYEQMEPIDITDNINYLCPSPIYQGSETAESDFSSDDKAPKSMNSFSSLTSLSSLTEDSPFGNGDNSSLDSPTTESGPSHDFDALTSLEEQLRFINLAKNNETGQDFFNQQRFVMAEYERNEPVDITNGMSYECSSPTFVTTSPDTDNISCFFCLLGPSTDINRCECCCEIIKDSRQSIHPLLSSIDYSAQSLDQCGRNRIEPLDDEKKESPSQHFDNGSSDDWSRCTKDSRACRNSPGMDQSYYEKAADPTGRGLYPTVHLGDFPESTLPGLFEFPAALDASSSFDDEYEDYADKEVFTEFNDQHLGPTRMEGGEDEHFPASCTRSSSEVDVFGSAPSAIERRVMSEFPGCSLEHARGMLDRRLHDKIARQLDSVDTCNQEETVMMEFEAGLGSGVCDDEDDGFSGEMEVDDDNHQEDWNDETRGVCEAGTSQQSSLAYPLDSGGR